MTRDLRTHEGEPVLVEVRCRVTTCWALLMRVFDPPPREEDWDTYVRLEICPRHGEGGGHGNIAAWVERRRRAGKPTDHVRLARWVPWSELRPAVEAARHTGRTQTFPF